jgi:hypothetical protein
VSVAQPHRSSLAENDFTDTAFEPQPHVLRRPGDARPRRENPCDCFIAIECGAELAPTFEQGFERVARTSTFRFERRGHSPCIVRSREHSHGFTEDRERPFGVFLLYKPTTCHLKRRLRFKIATLKSKKGSKVACGCGAALPCGVIGVRFAAGETIRAFGESPAI